MKRKIGITVGEPLGIGPEIVVRSLPQWESDELEFVVYGSPNLIEAAAKRCHVELPSNVTLRSCGPNPQGGEFSRPEDRADAVLATLDEAARDALAKKIAALVTAPIDKGIVRKRVPDFTGHTEYLARSAGGGKTYMLLDNGEIRVVLLTEHIPLRDVAATLTSERVESAVRLIVSSVREMWNLPSPRLALAGLNPHAGEIVTHSEETESFLPALEKLRKSGIEIEGPFAADSLFPLARSGKWDLLLSPYHDQGLVAAKYPGLDRVVNITLGLPYLRVSPGHGVAYDISGKKPADPRSFQRALRVAIEGKWHS